MNMLPSYKDLRTLMMTHFILHENTQGITMGQCNEFCNLDQLLH